MGSDQVERGPALKYYNAAFLVGDAGATVGVYRKMHLVPWGEYVPLKGLLSFVGPLVETVSDFSPGDRPVVLPVRGPLMSTAICYEIVYPGLVRQFVLGGSELLTTITNPTPADADLFGVSVAAMGSDRVVIGAYEDNTGGDGAGAAYLFSIAQAGVPSLTIQLTITNTVAVTWASPATGWTLQQNTNSVASANWSNAPGTIQDDGTIKTLIVNPPTGNWFFRLFKP